MISCFRTLSFGICISFVFVAALAQDRWSIRQNLSFNRSYCRVEQEGVSFKCLRNSITAGEHSVNIHFDADFDGKRAISFVVNDPPSAGIVGSAKVRFIAIADRFRNVYYVEGECLLSPQRFQCISDNGVFFASASY